MTPEQSLEIKTQISFSEALIQLSNETNPTPLTPDRINIPEIKNKFINAGINIEILETDPEYKKSILETQFRGPKQGKGPAIVVMLGGEEQYNKIFEWAMEVSKDQPKLTKGDESSKCRGLMQFIGETLALASGNISAEEYCHKTNWRVGKKFQKNPEISKKFNLPEDTEGLDKLKKTSSIPKGSALKAFEKILDLNK